jgi:superfamily II DNA helicase RecQ
VECECFLSISGTQLQSYESVKDDVWNQKTRTPGRAWQLIVTVEQLFKSREGHLPRLAIFLRKQHFQRYVVRIVVDEAHNIHTAGLPLYGLDAFRPAWGRLGELKAILH